jgi:hypothetical protein
MDTNKSAMACAFKYKQIHYLPVDLESKRVDSGKSMWRMTKSNINALDMCHVASRLFITPVDSLRGKKPSMLQFQCYINAINVELSTPFIVIKLLASRNSMLRGRPLVGLRDRRLGPMQRCQLSSSLTSGYCTLVTELLKNSPSDK